MSWQRTAEPDDVVIDVTCACQPEPVMVLEAAVPSWRCRRNHPAIEGQRWLVRGRVLDLDRFVQEGLDPIVLTQEMTAE